MSAAKGEKIPQTVEGLQDVMAADAVLIRDQDETISSLKAKTNTLLQQKTKYLKRIAALEAERRWIPVSERLPEQNMDVLVLSPETAYESASVLFEYFEDGLWMLHADTYEHFQAVGGAAAAGPDNTCSGPHEIAPYTHWMTIPNPPEVAE